MSMALSGAYEWVAPGSQSMGQAGPCGYEMCLVVLDDSSLKWWLETGSRFKLNNFFLVVFVVDLVCFRFWNVHLLPCGFVSYCIFLVRVLVLSVPLGRKTVWGIGFDGLSKSSRSIRRLDNNDSNFTRQQCPCDDSRLHSAGQSTCASCTVGHRFCLAYCEIRI